MLQLLQMINRSEGPDEIPTAKQQRLSNALSSLKAATFPLSCTIFVPSAQQTDNAPLATAALESRLQHVQASFDRSSSTLLTQLDEGLARLSGRIEVLESGLSDEERAAAEITAATRASPNSEELPIVRRRLENVADRVSVLEAASLAELDAAGQQQPERSFSVEKAATEAMVASAAAQAAKNAADQALAEAADQLGVQIEGRLLTELSAMEERVDRRSRDDARRAREEKEVSETRSSIRRVSTTISAYTADLAARIDGLVLDQEKTETDVVRATGEIAATEDGLKKIGEELLGLGQLTNNVRGVAPEKLVCDALNWSFRL